MCSMLACHFRGFYSRLREYTNHIWNNIGLRLTESEIVRINKVKVPWEDALGWSSATKSPKQRSYLSHSHRCSCPPSSSHSPTSTSASRSARSLSLQSIRPYGGDNKSAATEEFYILERYRGFFAHLRAVEALADRAGLETVGFYEKHGEKRDVTARYRGDVAEWVASAKVVTSDTGLRVTTGVFEATGSRATGRIVGLDRFWRDIRTHSLHDPVAYKNRELGEFAILDKVPEPNLVYIEDDQFKVGRQRYLDLGLVCTDNIEIYFQSPVIW
ncbi:hypothetical protein BP5796_09496 [Coleophoma crateriformis]|uniref:Acyl-CoA dehydrogenase C-terminal domain-containing protein n=1 Tax=Coleophoma crateriformis TaxID=565419 RepID=A0A3D8QYA1_9HELO|nr:hypothetical protein BP5796_09496 [Coleophoma crateriformis]